MKSSKPTVVARFMHCAASLSIAGSLSLAALPIQAAQPADISQGALDQIGALLQEKISWTPVQAKMDSQLIHALKNHRGLPFAAGVPHLSLDLETKPDGRVLADLTANVSSNLLALISQGGG